MRAPEFWRHDGATARLLAPLSHLYEAGALLSRAARTPRRIGVPVLCVGNLVAGGAGKTPTALALVGLLRQLGRQPHFLTRGYGGREAGPLRVSGREPAAAVGDEALLLARQAPTWVARDRVAGAEAAVAAGADCVVLDDGFQNPSLAKDLSFVVVDAGYGFGNGRLMPAGPLREPVARGLVRADAVVWIETALPESRRVPRSIVGDRPLLPARLVPTIEAERLAGGPAVAFAGIGRPEKFFETLVAMGVEVVEGHRFADHHVYDSDEIMRLVEAASRHEARLLTTAKDFVRLPEEARAMVDVVDVRLEFEAPAAVTALLAGVAGDG
ncbi:MAG: tetraacyldisaccharide 4'-kinase [Alphaproteobacteria bacterium]|jgi:tetraacyldisaccharide 4'-kinase|nr:tetraacyldisaccharide 4'-kinase [Alphaproteobacteria bacterium]